MKQLLLAVVCLAVAVQTTTAAPAFQVYNPPGPNVEIAPGFLNGWGFRMTVDFTNWILIEQSYVRSETDPIGTYTDLTYTLLGDPNHSYLFPAGSGTWSSPFDYLAETGLGYYTVDPTAHIGDTDTLIIRVTYDSINGDPANCSPGCRWTNGFQDLTVNVTVVAAPNASDGSGTVFQGSPEPGSSALLAIGLVFLSPKIFPGVLAKFRRRSPFSH